MVKKAKELVKATLGIFADKHYYNSNLTFAQAGEDKVVEFLFTSMGVPSITYLEIGTNHPIHFNNTFLFYLKGSRGVCIEPNPMLIPAIKKNRPADTVLNVGIGKDKSAGLDFYIFDDQDEAKGLSTFSKEEADYITSTTSIKIARVEKIPVVPVTDILQQHFATKAPDFISLDVEGLEMDILGAIGFDKVRPTALCVETVNFSVDHKRTKRTELIDYMIGKNYFVYADTGINSIFVDKNLF